MPIQLSWHRSLAPLQASAVTCGLQAIHNFSDPAVKVAFLDTPGYTEQYQHGFKATVESLLLNADAAVYLLDLSNLGNQQVSITLSYSTAMDTLATG